MDPRQATAGSGPGPIPRRNNHLRIMALMVGCAALVTAAALGLVQARSTPRLTWEERWSMFCWFLLLSWWIVYFNHRRLGIINLRAFLDSKNPFRRQGEKRKEVEDPAAQEENQRRIVAKSTSSIGAQGIQIAIIALLLNQVLSDDTMTPFRAFVRPWIVTLAMVTILLLCFAIDILDTSANIFDPGSQSEHEYRQWFFRNVGPFAPKGGVTYAYYGFAGLSIFFVIALSYLYIPLAGLGVASYVYLGYPYFYGYHHTGAGVEIDAASAWPALVFASSILTATAIFHWA